MKKGYNTPKVELIKIDDSDLIVTSNGCGDGNDHGNNNRGNQRGCKKNHGDNGHQRGCGKHH